MIEFLVGALIGAVVARYPKQTAEAVGNTCKAAKRGVEKLCKKDEPKRDDGVKDAEVVDE